MSHLPITDADRAAWRQVGGDQGAFAALVHDTMQAVGATPAPATPPSAAPARPAPITAELPPYTMRHLFGAGVAVAIGLLALFAVARPLFNQAAQPAPAEPLPPAVSRITSAPAPTVLPPTAIPVNALQRAIVAYAAPGGVVIGPIEPGRAYTATARYGSAWVQLQVAGSGLIWTEAAIVGGDIAALPDLTPPTAIPAPIWQPAPQAPIATMVPANEMRNTRPTAIPSPTMIVPRPPPRAKPLQPPVNQDSGRADLLNRVEAAGWPVSSIGRAVTP